MNWKQKKRRDRSHAKSSPFRELLQILFYGNSALQQIPLFIERDGEADGGRQQQIVHRGGTDLVVGVGDVQHTQQDDDEDAAQQQRVEDGLAGGFVEESTQRESGQRQQHAPRGGPGQEAL